MDRASKEDFFLYTHNPNQTRAADPDLLGPRGLMKQVSDLIARP